MSHMRNSQKGTRVQFRLRTLLWGTMWFALLLALCIRQQQATTRQRETWETLRGTGLIIVPAAKTTTSGPAAPPPTSRANPTS